MDDAHEGLGRFRSTRVSCVLSKFCGGESKPAGAIGAKVQLSPVISFCNPTHFLRPFAHFFTGLAIADDALQALVAAWIIAEHTRDDVNGHAVAFSNVNTK